MVTVVSIAKNKAKMIKKLIFSYPTLEFPECNMGDKTAYEIPILMQVTKRNVYPTLSMFLDFTQMRINRISKEQMKKNP